MTNIKQALERQCQNCSNYDSIIDFDGHVHYGCVYQWQPITLGCKDKC
jgi:hypothetical protein